MMEDNLEIYFCEICSESVPLQDITSKAAREIKGKVIGACCMPQVAAPAQSRSGSPVGLTTLGAVVLAGIAAATVFLESRLTDEVDALGKDMTKVKATVASQGDLWEDLEKRLDNTMQRGALKPLTEQIEGVEDRVTKAQKALGVDVKATNYRFAGLEEMQKRLVDGQSSIRREIKDVENEILRLERDVAAAAAAPRARVPDRSVGDASAKPKVEPKAKDDALPAPLAAQVTRLKDGDAGNRFEAVDQLVQSKNPQVQEHLLPMLKDPDAFVRRLTAEGLASFKQKTTVDALLVALADPESIVRHTSHTSLKKLTGQTIAFDPDGSTSARSAAQRRWKEWWSKNRDKF